MDNRWASDGYWWGDRLFNIINWYCVACNIRRSCRIPKTNGANRRKAIKRNYEKQA